jgi:DNA (cytosine-5)-methyltransferase 1
VKYLSVCSGIEAATVAWHPLGWSPVAFSEVDAFPSAVLAHHYPTVPNRGDMTKFQEWPDAAFDVLVGGTPCQSFSVAGLRAGLDDPRGNLMLVYLAIARRYRPRWVVWENVPGVLSSNGGRDFGTFLGGLAECGYGFAYRVLDAQYFGLAQRRKRVFVVGHLGDWHRPGAVLSERASLSGHPAPRREARQGVTPILEAGARTGRSTTDIRAGIGIGEPGDPMFTLQAGKQHGVASLAPTIPSRRSGGGGLGTDFDTDGGLIASTGAISHCLNAGGMGRIDYESETLIAHSLKADGFDASEDGTGRGTPLVPCAFDARQSDVLQYGNLSGPLDTDGTSIAVAFSSKDYGADAGDIAPTLRAGGHTTSHANGGVMPAVAFNLRGREGGAMPELSDVASLRAASGGSSRSYVGQHMAVRRLTPRECERLQGFPDDYTLIPYRGKLAADGPRYKALGNSMAVPVMRWIGERIQKVEAL